MTDVADADLLRRFARDRDQPAFAQLVQRHGPLVLGVCRRALGPGQDADEGVQATFLVLVRHASRLAGSGDLAPWLHRVAQRLARRLARQRARRRTREATVSSLPEMVSPPEAETPELAQLLPHLDEALAGLPERERAVLVLCFLEGRSQREAAAVLAIPDGSASRLIAQGLGRLRTALGRCGVPVGAIAAAGLAGDLPAATPTLCPPLPEGLSRTIADQAAGAAPPAAVLAATGTTMPFLPIALCAGLLATGATFLAIHPRPTPGPAAVAGESVPPVAIVWPREGIALEQKLANFQPLRWNRRGDAIMVRGWDGSRMLVTATGSRKLEALGLDPGSSVEGVWLADGRWIHPGRSVAIQSDGSTASLERSAWTGLLAVDGAGQREMLPPPPESGRDWVWALPDASRVLVQRDGAKRQVVAAWVVTSGVAEPHPLPLPQVDGATLSGVRWGADGAIHASFSRPDPNRELLREQRVVRRRSSDLGATWTEMAGESLRQRPRGPYPLGSMRSVVLGDAVSWDLPVGGTVAVLPALPEPGAVQELAVPPANALVVSDPHGVQQEVPWPAAAGDRPWPMARLVDGSLLVARHRRMALIMGAPWSTWHPVIEGWAILAPTGDLQPIELPVSHLSQFGPVLDLDLLLLAADHAALAFHAFEPATLLLVRPGQPPSDLAGRFGLAGGWGAEIEVSGKPGSIVPQAMALLTRPQHYGRCPGPRQLLAWSGSITPTLIHRSQDLADAVSAFAWDASGRRLAWVQGDRLRVWTAGEPGLPLPAVEPKAKSDF